MPLLDTAVWKFDILCDLHKERRQEFLQCIVDNLPIYSMAGLFDNLQNRSVQTLRPHRHLRPPDDDPIDRQQLGTKFG